MTDRVSWRLDHLGAHVHIGVWVNGAKSGDLVFRDSEKDAIALFTRALERAGATRMPGTDTRS